MLHINDQSLRNNFHKCEHISFLWVIPINFWNSYFFLTADLWQCQLNFSATLLWSFLMPEEKPVNGLISCFFFWCFKNQLLRYVMASYLSLVDGTSRQKLNILKVRSEPTTFTGLETSVYFRLTVGKQQWRKWKQKAQRYRNI